MWQYLRFRMLFCLPVFLCFILFEHLCLYACFSFFSFFWPPEDCHCSISDHAKTVCIPETFL